MQACIKLELFVLVLEGFLSLSFFSLSPPKSEALNGYEFRSFFGSYRSWAILHDTIGYEEGLVALLEFPLARYAKELSTGWMDGVQQTWHTSIRYFWFFVQ